MNSASNAVRDTNSFVETTPNGLGKTPRLSYHLQIESLLDPGMVEYGAARCALCDS